MNTQSPIDPDRKRSSTRRGFKVVPMRLLLPNIVTLLALCAGITSIRMGVAGRYELAVGLIVLAAVFDALDGRIARFLKGTSRFGAELDSLADFVNFGVAPAMLVFVWSLDTLKNLGWIVALAFALCCALRLARFNVALDDEDAPAWKANFFSGVPAPAGAAIALLPLYLGFHDVIDGPTAAPFILIYMAFAASLMVSKVPTWSGKNLGKRISSNLVLPVLLVAVLFAVLLVSYPWFTMSALVTCYMATFPFSYRSFKRQEAEEAASKD
ncbi:MAG: CDP-diacylglycerol--serine O-phosphatidyltransferase [Rhizobiales bacterium]|nr:CDP-diacylglycerol--serine O-phosphatidyltransferase [Hyphomicrobiales bacterium]